ncbi:MAG: hypothetical protein V1734_03225 [Nanoarchaeota archaeon]
MGKKKAVKKEAKNNKSIANVKKAVIEKGRALTPVIKNNKTARIVAAVMAFALVVLLIVSYFPRGTLEVTVTDIYGEAMPGTEVWIWDRDDFKGKPEKRVEADENGIAEVKLFRGEYAISLASELRTGKDIQPVKYSTFFAMKRAEDFKLALIKQN